MSHPHTPSPVRPSNGLGISGFVVGLIGLLFSFIPVIGVIAWPLVILGIIFSGIGMTKRIHKGLSIAGLTVSVIGLVICIVWAAALGNAVNDVNDKANQQTAIVYEVTGTATNVTIIYSSFGDSMATVTENAVTLPWRKELTVSGWGKGGTLSATAQPGAGTVNCKVTIDGKEVKSQNGSGEFPYASCAGF